MPLIHRRLLFLLSLLCGILWIGPAVDAEQPAEPIRVATFNVALNREKAGQLHDELRNAKCPQAEQLAKIIKTVRPQVLLVNELDFGDGTNAKLFHDVYLNQGEDPISYAYRFVAPVNTGVPAKHDLDGNGKTDGPGDCFGFGQFPGQYGMAVYSSFPIDAADVRTFQHFLWSDMPNSLFPPKDPKTNEPIYAPDVMKVFRLSSKSHWDVPIRIGGEILHFLVSHPTPPVFDGPEDRNGRRNHDEIRFWADYIDAAQSDYLRDDQGRTGGLSSNSHFIIAGDLNADPQDGDSFPGAANQLLQHPLISVDAIPVSKGGVEQSQVQRGANETHQGNPENDTGDFPDTERAPGNLRVDYVLPSRTLTVVGSGVFWPLSDEPEFAWVSASDHRLVWVDVKFGPSLNQGE